MNKYSNKIFICATEQSGDNIGNKLIQNLILIDKHYIFEGVGGSKMSLLMNKQFYSLSDFKSIGLIEILSSLKKYISMIYNLSDLIIKNNYKIVITIDSPDFNFPLAKKIRNKGFKGKIIQIVLPTVWAWRKYRSKKFADMFDHLFSIFPFENAYFEKYSSNISFIGNPIYHINSSLKRNHNKKYFVFLPGSREREINSLINYFKIASDYLYEISSELIIVIPTLPHLNQKIINLTTNWKKKPMILIDRKDIEKIYLQTSMALVCSGTASLEVVKRNIPQMIIYKLNFFTEFILKFMVKVKYANIVNIMANKMIIKEVTNSNLNNISFLNNFKNLVHNYKKNNDNQIKFSKIYLDQLILGKSPEELAAKKINELFL